MSNIYAVALLFPPGKRFFCKNKPSFLAEYLYYSKVKDHQNIKEVQARINFYQNSYDIFYKLYGDEAYFLLESDSFEDAHERMSSLVENLSNIFQMDIAYTHLFKTQKSLVDIVGTDKLK
jgi:hypothetical protein